MKRLRFLYVVGVDAGVYRTAARYELELLLGDLSRNVSAEVAVGNKEYLVVIYPAANLNRRGRGHAHVADCLEVCGGVDVGDYGIIRQTLLHLLDELSVHLVCHRAARVGVGQIDALVGRKQLAGLRHKAHAAHDDIFIADLACVDAELVAVAREVRDLKYLLRLIAVGKDTDVLLLFQPDYLVLNIADVHIILLYASA